MLLELTFTGFCDALEKAGRADYYSYEGKKALYDYLENQNPEYVFDPIELTSTYTENNALDIIHEYGLKDDDEDNAREVVRKFFAEHDVNVIAETDYGFLYENFEI